MRHLKTWSFLNIIGGTASVKVIDSQANVSFVDVKDNQSLIGKKKES
jgi:hypothetical protein